jgi:asparagine synthase (glutamine-hydrolysing)
MLLRQIAASGVVVVLDGQGGDELLSGYPWYGHVLVDAIRRRGVDCQALEIERRKHMPISAGLLDFFEQIFVDPRAWVRGFMGGNDFLGVPADLVCELPETRYYLGGGSDWNSLRQREYFQGDLPLLLRQEDRLGMWFGLECRVPFVDRDMVETASRLTPELLLRDGYLKYPFRVMLPEIPESIRWNTKKRGFWETDTARFPWLTELGHQLVMESSVLPSVFPKLETGWPALNFDQQWRLLQSAVLERCATRNQAKDLCAEIGQPRLAITESA